MLLPLGLGLRGAEILAAVPALVAGHRLVIVLCPPGAVLPIEAPGWVHVVRAGQIGADRTGVLHAADGIKSASFIKYLAFYGHKPLQNKALWRCHQSKSSPGMSSVGWS